MFSCTSSEISEEESDAALAQVSSIDELTQEELEQRISSSPVARYIYTNDSVFR